MKNLAGVGAMPPRMACPPAVSWLLLLIAILAGFLTGGPRPAEASSDRDPPVARSMERPRFAFDAGTVWHNGGPWVEAQIVVPYSELMFRPVDGAFRATFDLIVILYDDGSQLTGDLWHETVEARTLAETRSSQSHFQRLISLPGRTGKLRVEATVSEQDSGNEGKLSLEIEIHEPGSRPIQIGKIWFARCGSDSPSSPRPATGELLVGRRFGTGTGPVCAWTQVRIGQPRDTTAVDVYWKVVGERGDRALDGRLHLEAPGDSVSVSFRLPIESLWLGGYELSVEATVGGERSVRTTEFDMDESMVSLEHNPAESIALVSYVATSDEIAKLEDAPPDGRVKAWEEFWKQRDPSPETVENEFKSEFFRRVRYANENFSALGPGWRTDRGMIYIQYGAPDQVESYPHNMDSPPYEIWYYYGLQRRFVFVDYDGFGHYELYTPGRLR